MSNTMHPNRKRLLDEAKSLGIVGRHKMSQGDLQNAINSARAKKEEVPTVNWGPGALYSLMGPEDSAAEQLRRALAEKVVDRWPVGTVLRWESVGGGAMTYVYTAVRAPGGRWFTSAAEYNRYVPQIVDYEDLVEILSRSETHNIQYASGWTPVDGDGPL